MSSGFVSAREAADILQISLPTLYTYVSRGLIHSEARAGDIDSPEKRNRHYRREDIERLRQRREQSRNPDQAAAKALHLGSPILDSAITLISNDRFYYRGHDVAQLATQRSVADVASLIWTGSMEGADSLFERQQAPAIQAARELRRAADRATEAESRLVGSPIYIWQDALPAMAVADPSRYDLRPSAVAQTGVRILTTLAALTRVPLRDNAHARRISNGPARLSGYEVAGTPVRCDAPTSAGTPVRCDAPTVADSASIVHSLCRGWGIDLNPRSISLLNAALILCADHELNATSFAARCVASAGATPHAVVIAGMAAVQGINHGGATKRVEAFLAEAQTPSGVRAAMTSRLERGEPIPGFGHALYPKGDPRAQVLLSLVAESSGGAAGIELIDAVVREGYRLIGEFPTVHLGLVAVATALNLPPGAALGLLALGRTIGWIGHAIEQYECPQLIRPRARYIGPQPK